MYHGWCYDESGACTDMPLEPKASRAKEHIHLKSYPVQEMGGLLFAYLGPPPAPILPPWELFVLPNSLRQIGYTVLPCNWLQCHENASDPTHTIYTHGYFGEYNFEVRGGIDMGFAHFKTPDRVDGFSHVHSEMDEYGLQKACVFKQSLGAQRDKMNWHSTTMFPNYVRVGQTNGLRHEYQIRVPIDDETTLHFAYEAYFAPPEVEVPTQEIIPSYEVPLVDESGNEILDHVLAQDFVAWKSQGAIADRTTENLGVTDSAVKEFRELLLRQVVIMESGEDPMNVYRDESNVPEVIQVNPRICDWDSLRQNSVVIRGFGSQSDRFGSINAQIEALWERIRESQKVESRI
jgi:5,5'-dehydrodivanillate O-demethylase